MKFSFLIPNSIKSKMLPKTKEKFGNRHLLCLIVRQISLPVSYYLLAPFKIAPNVITILSMIVGAFAGVFLVLQNYILGSVLMIFWAFLDCCDGELARLTEKQSKIGEVLEVMNSNLQYVIWLPCLAFGLYSAQQITLFWFFMAGLMCGIFNVIRNVYGTYPVEIVGEPKGWLKVFIACQFKNMESLREKHIVSSSFFTIWRNIITQQGIFEILLLVFAMFYTQWLGVFTIFFVSAYMLFVGITLMAIIVMGFVKPRL